jgi:hypothetical protein
VLVLNATNGSAQSIAISLSADLSFSANQTVTSGYGSFNGTTYTASSTGAGTYLVTISVYSTTVAAPQLTLIVGGSNYAVSSGASSTNGDTNGRANLSQIVVLPNSGTIRINCINSNTTTALSTSTDGTTRFTIVKLN